MTGIDSAMLDLIEWFCRRFQLLTGRTNVWLAAQLTNLSIVLYFVWVATYFQRFPGTARVAVGIFGALVLYVLSQTVFKESLEMSEHFAYRRVANGFRNPRRVRDASLRISFLTLSVFFLYPFLMMHTELLGRVVRTLRISSPLLSLGYPLILLTTVVLYVLACDPLPPCVGRVKEWLAGFALSRSRIPDSASG
jgi:hypothetical protein